MQIMRRDLSINVTILLIEDGTRSQHLLRVSLEPLGYRLVVCEHDTDVLEALTEHQPSLVILDITLPHSDGFQVCRYIRTASSVPVIILSGHGQLSDKVRGLEAGADDYVTKPFDPMELAVRIEAVLRRARAQPTPSPRIFRSGDLTIDFDQRSVTQGGVETLLTRTEYRLLAYLAQHAGRTIVADSLIEAVWGDEYRGDYASLHLYISRLRSKLHDDARHPRYIATKLGIGYMMLVHPSETVNQHVC